jgi:hypothetical protein
MMRSRTAGFKQTLIQIALYSRILNDPSSHRSVLAAKSSHLLVIKAILSHLKLKTLILNLTDLIEDL